VVRRATLGEQLCQAIQDIVGSETPGDLDRQALPGELVDDGEHAELAPVARLVLDEVVGPDVPGPAGPQPQARSIIEPQASSSGLSSRDFEPLPPPDPMHALDVHRPAIGPEQGRDPAIAMGWRAWWRWKSRNPGGRPMIDRELRDLVRRMCAENLLWARHAFMASCLNLASMSHSRRFRNTC